MFRLERGGRGGHCQLGLLGQLGLLTGAPRPALPRWRARTKSGKRKFWRPTAVGRSKKLVSRAVLRTLQTCPSQTLSRARRLPPLRGRCLRSYLLERSWRRQRRRGAENLDSNCGCQAPRRRLCCRRGRRRRQRPSAMLGHKRGSCVRSSCNPTPPLPSPARAAKEDQGQYRSKAPERGLCFRLSRAPSRGLPVQYHRADLCGLKGP